MLIGDGLHESEVMERLLPMEEQLGRTILSRTITLSVTIHRWA